ncbi:MAG: hypothetical protein Q4E61_03970 [Alphaproteobacteria bacterium]|nr:hypothetical protein [Alphaproteobacteria bacterium]
MNNKKIILFILVLIMVVLGSIYAFVLSNSETEKYIVITSSKYATMENDGGSNHNIYYKFDLKNNVVKKLEDYYVGFKGYKYRGKVIYKKRLKPYYSKKTKKLLDDLFEKKDVRSANNYEPYTIEVPGGTSKKIYNKSSIRKLEKLLSKIDNL